MSKKPLFRRKTSVTKSKEQIAFELKQGQETRRRREFVTSTFFPLLQRHTKNINQAKQFCKIFQTDIMATFNEGMKAPVSSLNLEKKLEGFDDEGTKIFKEFIEAFKDLSITDAMEIVGGMPQAIEGAMSVDDRTRSMDELQWKEDGTLLVKNETRLSRLLRQADCNDLRMLSNGRWFAYSTRLDKEGVAIRGSGSEVKEAVESLIQELAKQDVTPKHED